MAQQENFADIVAGLARSSPHALEKLFEDAVLQKYPYDDLQKVELIVRTAPLLRNEKYSLIASMILAELFDQSRRLYTYIPQVEEIIPILINYFKNAQTKEEQFFYALPIIQMYHNFLNCIPLLKFAEAFKAFEEASKKNPVLDDSVKLLHQVVTKRPRGSPKSILLGGALIVFVMLMRGATKWAVIVGISLFFLAFARWHSNNRLERIQRGRAAAFRPSNYHPQQHLQRIKLAKSKNKKQEDNQLQDGFVIAEKDDQIHVVVPPEVIAAIDRVPKLRQEREALLARN